MGRAVQRRGRRRAGRASERLVVPRKPRNGGGGKGPRFWNAAKGATGSEIGVMPVHSELIPDLWWELYGRVKRDVRGRDARLRRSRGSAVNPVGEPDAGKLHVRFDERESETEP